LQDSSSHGDLRLVGDFKVLSLFISRRFIDRYVARPQYHVKAEARQRGGEARLDWIAAVSRGG